MILESIDINVFAGLSSTGLEFAPGVNVVLGPNEAGKSTVYHAIRSALITPAGLGKRDFGRLLERYLPAAGGDTLEAELTFVHEGRRYRISRVWGGAPATRLELPDGGVVTDDRQAQETIRSLFPAPAATVVRVFLTGQADLAGTIDRLAEDPTVFSSVSDYLRRSVLDTGGVSIETFRRRLSAELSESLGRWDLRHGGPEQGRGIDNPWKQRVGRVLETWYAAERVRRDLDAARRGELEIQRCNEVIAEQDAAIAQADEFLTVHEDAVRAATRREKLETRLATLRRALDEMRADYDRWPELERTAAQLREDLSRRRSELPELRENLAAAKRTAELAGVRDRVERVDRARKSLEELHAAESEIPSVTDEGIDELRAVAKKRDRFAQALKSGRITLSLTSDRATEVVVSRPDGETETVSLDTGRGKTLRVGGAATIVHDGLEVTMQSGDEDPAKTAAELERLDNRFEELLTLMEVDTPEAAEVAFAERGRLNARRDSLRHNIEEALAGTEYSELEAAIADTPETSDESIEEIAGRIAKTEERIASQSAEIGRVEESVQRLAQEYNDRDSLFKRLASTATEIETLEAEHGELPEIPEPFDTAEELISAYEQARGRRDGARERRERLRIERAEIESSLPDVSAEELNEELAAAEADHARELSHAHTIGRILERTDALLEAPDTELFSELEKRFTDLLSRATGRRYTGTVGPDSVPRTAIRRDGLSLDFSRLSQGTKNVFALCLRLALVAVYTEGNEGFMMLDDPLVDLDPERQNTVARLLSELQAPSQQIIFTCHPSHAALFEDANLIRLEAGGPQL